MLSSVTMRIFDPACGDTDTIPNGTGLYMIGVKREEALGDWFHGVKISKFKDTPIIYLGVSETQGLRKRLSNHLQGTARNSTLRKSLGSLFSWQVDRIFDDSGKYKFNARREHQLSSWMSSNLIIFYWNIAEQEANEFEKKLIDLLNPPLNISKNNSPINRDFRTRLSDLRNMSNTN